ncbi:hypothetical protein DPMN_118726 [Dreissena polymorpha]|uniref:Uncharacterized protein n=1 Tax=Dreissena polymorpha TaxID=45954 RepID=A0A9D4GKN0_DREPO|nr:hypothetical protein DPMN_118726 [Dreissena polymorpha]
MDNNRIHIIAAQKDYENCPQVQYEHVASTSPTELSNVIQFNTLEHQYNTVPTHPVDMKTISQIPSNINSPRKLFLIHPHAAAALEQHKCMVVLSL